MNNPGKFLLFLVPLCVFSGLTGCSSTPTTAATSTTAPTTTTSTPAAVVAPTVTSIAPAVIAAGAAATSVTVTGTGFDTTTTLQVSGAVEATTFRSSTQVTATVSASQLLSGGLLPVIAVNSTASSATGTAVNLEVDNPMPRITSFVPSSLTTGSGVTSVSVAGTGFVPTTVVQVNGSSRATFYVSPSQVNVTLTAADLASPASIMLTAMNVSPGGGSSAAASVAVNNPAPTLSALAPSTVTTGVTTGATIAVSGSGFLPSSVVQVGGVPRVTTYVSATQLSFQLTVADQAAVARLAISVLNAAPGGGTSFALALTVAVPTITPVINSLSPNQFIVNSSVSSIQVSGLNLTTNSTVLWNGTALSTGFVSILSGGVSYLSATVPANLLTSLGTASVTVSSPTATPALSNALTVTIVNPPAPTLTSISPNTGAINTAVKVTLYGTGFTTSSTVAYNGTTLPTTYVTSTSLMVTLPASSIALPGNGSFTVTTPAPGGGTTAGLVYTAYIGIANNSMVYNPVNGLFYVSVPGSAGAPYGNSVVSVDPATGALGTPIAVGSEPDQLAVTSDGRFLWVSLDGAVAVRKVDLTTGTAGLQFSLGASSGYSGLPTVYALAALPGATDSVVVSTTGNYPQPGLGIYDSGVLRGTPINVYPYGVALQVDGSRSEVYTISSGSYSVYSYSASGLTQRSTVSNNNFNYSLGSNDLQVTGGRAYLDSGRAIDAESGALLGTFYSTGTTVATGPIVADTVLGKVFMLDSVVNYSPYPSQIQVFNLNDFTSGSSAIPVNGSFYTYSNAAGSHLTRWGANGLAFRNASGVYSLQSNLVKDLSTTPADLGVTLAATGSNATGGNTTYVATVTNAGPSAATSVGFAAFLPSTGSLVSVISSSGTCSTSNGLSCDLGSLANGASATVTLVVTQTTVGSVVLTAQVSGSENDTNAANNQATSTLTITGSGFNLAPTISAVSPASVVSGSSDTVITVMGTGFTSGSSVLLSGAALPTTFSSGTQLTATVPAASLATLGWAPVTVSTPAPGGGTTGAIPLSVYSVITLGVNRMVYDPFSRKIMASVGSGSSSVTGNSIVAITPETVAVGTPVSIGSQPTNLALTSDGQILYAILSGSQSLARFNMLTQQPDFTFAIPTTGNVFTMPLSSIATQPGTENTVALSFSTYGASALYDFNPSTRTAAARGLASGPYVGSCLTFLDAGDLLGYSNSLVKFPVTSAGFTSTSYSQITSASLNHFGCFKLSGGNAFSIAGGVANPGPTLPVQLGTFPLSTYFYGSEGNVAPDASLRRTFYAVSSTGNSSTVDSIQAFDTTTYLASGSIPLGFATVEGSSTSYTVADLIRWGQDGLAVLTTGGHLYLVRGAAVVPQMLQQNAAATLSASSSTAIAHGSGNTLLTLTGSGFVPGAAVTWNGGYRTTTIVDATHVTVAVPASDVAAAGTGSLVVTNPGAAASSALTVTIN